MPATKQMIIGFCGNARSGKNTAAEGVQKLTQNNRQLNLSFTSAAFADPLREIAQIMGFTKAELTNQELKEKLNNFWAMTPRTAMQLIGTEMFRTYFGAECWVKLMEKKIIEWKEKTKNGFFCITDVRFLNEAEMIKREGGIIVKLERPGNKLDPEMAKHPSEVELQKIEPTLVFTNEFDDSNSSSPMSIKEFQKKIAGSIMNHFYKIDDFINQ